MQKLASEDKLRKKYFTVSFMVKALDFSEEDGFDIEGQI